MKSRKIKRHIKVKSAYQFIGIIQTPCCYVPQMRTWHQDRFIKSTSRCIMRHQKTKCLNRVWNRKNDSN